MRNLLFGISIFWITVNGVAQNYRPEWSSLNQRAMPEWYGNAKFGIFMHWGIYAVPAWATNSNADGFGSNYAEWYWQRLNDTALKIHKEFVAFHEKTYGKDFKYADFAPMFKCELFDAEQWARILQNSGAKYVVLTSKHHDGFCLWPSAQAPGWNAVETGPKRNLLQELSTAVKKTDLHMGYYYSLYEWYNPQYRKETTKYVAEHMLPQMKELVTAYEPDILWTDGEWEQSSATWNSREFLSWLFNESSVKKQIVVNDRWGNDARGKFTACIQTSEYGSGNITEKRVWEETRGIGASFGYNRNESLAEYASSADLIKQLIEVVAKGGNLLLNIGPNADGTIPVIMQQRLKDIGDWLKVNGDAIYNTVAWSKAPPIGKNSTLFYTAKEKNIYAITTEWKEKLDMPISVKPANVEMLGYTGKVKFHYKNNKLVITAPPVTPANNPCNTAWVYKISLP